MKNLTLDDLKNIKYLTYTGSKDKITKYVNAEDHYWYDANGKTSAKYFSPRYSWKYFYEPCLNDIPRIERVYYKVIKRIDDLSNRISSLIVQIKADKSNSIIEYSKKINIAHFKAKGGYGYYKIDEDNCYGFDWCDFKPTKFYCLKEGNLLSSYDDKRSKLYTLKNKIEEIFILAIKKSFENQADKMLKQSKMYKRYNMLIYKDTIIDINVNNRSYAFINESLYERYDNTYKKHYNLSF